MPEDATNALANQASMAVPTSQVETQPLPPPDPLEPLKPAASEQWQQEQPQEQARSNAQEQVHAVLDRAVRQSTTDLHESAVRLRIVESEEVAEKGAKEEKENRESKERKRSKKKKRKSEQKKRS